jgi:hypothetical protein
MTGAGRAVRAVGHPTVATLAKHRYDTIAERDDLTLGQQVGAVLGTVLLQFLGHVAVEAAADWIDDTWRGRG